MLLYQQNIKEIKKNAKINGFASVSSYVKYLFNLEKDLISETELLNSIQEARKEYKAGKSIKAGSLADLV